jgi:hypothetical protein
MVDPIDDDYDHYNNNSKMIVNSDDFDTEESDTKEIERSFKQMLENYCEN